MKTDFEIQRDVMDELKWDPIVNTSEIGVAVNDGVVTLFGQVNSYARKLAAEKAAKRVSGVKAIAEDVQVNVLLPSGKSDTEIAEAILAALKWHTAVQQEKIKVTVEDGFVTLEGEVEWEYQRSYAVKVIEHLAGVRYIANLVVVKPTITGNNIQQKIISAFQRSATVDASTIVVDVTGSKVVLQGKVRSFAEAEDAIAAAWAAPGVTSVETNIVIEIPELALAD